MSKATKNFLNKSTTLQIADNHNKSITRTLNSTLNRSMTSKPAQKNIFPLKSIISTKTQTLYKGDFEIHYERPYTKNYYSLVVPATKKFNLSKSLTSPIQSSLGGKRASHKALIKIFDKQNVVQKNLVDNIKTEIYIHEELKQSQFLLGFQGAFEDKQFLYFVFESIEKSVFLSDLNDRPNLKLVKDIREVLIGLIVLMVEINQLGYSLIFKNLEEVFITETKAPRLPTKKLGANQTHLGTNDSEEHPSTLRYLKFFNLGNKCYKIGDYPKPVKEETNKTQKTLLPLEVINFDRVHINSSIWNFAEIFITLYSGKTLDFLTDKSRLSSLAYLKESCHFPSDILEVVDNIFRKNPGKRNGLLQLVKLNIFRDFIVKNVAFQQRVPIFLLGHLKINYKGERRRLGFEHQETKDKHKDSRNGGGKDNSDGLSGQNGDKLKKKVDFDFGVFGDDDDSEGRRSDMLDSSIIMSKRERHHQFRVKRRGVKYADIVKAKELPKIRGRRSTKTRNCVGEGRIFDRLLDFFGCFNNH